MCSHVNLIIDRIIACIWVCAMPRAASKYCMATVAIFIRKSSQFLVQFINWFKTINSERIFIAILLSHLNPHYPAMIYSTQVVAKSMTNFWNTLKMHLKTICFTMMTITVDKIGIYFSQMCVRSALGMYAMFIYILTDKSIEKYITALILIDIYKMKKTWHKIIIIGGTLKKNRWSRFKFQYYIYNTYTNTCKYKYDNVIRSR